MLILFTLLFVVCYSIFHVILTHKHIAPCCIQTKDIIRHWIFYSTQILFTCKICVFLILFRTFTPTVTCCMSHCFGLKEFLLYCDNSIWNYDNYSTKLIVLSIGWFNKTVIFHVDSFSFVIWMIFLYVPLILPSLNLFIWWKSFCMQNSN